MKAGKIYGAATPTTSPRSVSNDSNPSVVIGQPSVQENKSLPNIPPNPPPAEKAIKKHAANNNISNKNEKKQSDEHVQALDGFKNPHIGRESTLVEFDRFSTSQADEIGDKKHHVRFIIYTTQFLFFY